MPFSFSAQGQGVRERESTGGESPLMRGGLAQDFAQQLE
ncbi:hypothetical protein VFA_002526 [Vibrio furnissii CIP 102972]|nr:hypothetical protein VFA_002526 [Vibrio furnissii CIP 102972]